MKDYIEILNKLILSERKLQLSAHTYSRRTHSMHSTPLNAELVLHPKCISTSSDLPVLFQPLTELLMSQHDVKVNQDQTNIINLLKPPSLSHNREIVFEQISHVGARIKVLWGSDELGDSGWKPGWYTANVQGYDSDTDILTIQYPSEPGCTYNIALTPMYSKGSLKLVRPVL